MPNLSLELGYESGRGELKQASKGLNGPYWPIQTLQLGYESGLGERKQAS